MREDTIADAMLSELANYLNTTRGEPLGDGTVSRPELIDEIESLLEDDGDDNDINLNHGYHFTWTDGPITFCFIYFVIEQEQYLVMLDPKSHALCCEGHITVEDGVYSVTRSEVCYDEPERLNWADDDTRSNILLKMIALRGAASVEDEDNVILSFTKIARRP